MLNPPSQFVMVIFQLAILAAAGCCATAAKAGESPATQPSVVEKVNLAQFEAMRQDKNAVVLDVRTEKEFSAGHVPCAINIDWRQRNFNEQVAKLDKSKKYLVHCMAGGRSAAATRRMSTLDFAHLFDYSGGWSEYSKAAKPIEK